LVTGNLLEKSVIPEEYSGFKTSEILKLFFILIIIIMFLIY